MLFWCLVLLFQGVRLHAAEDPVSMLKESLSNLISVESIAFERTQSFSNQDSFFLGRWDHGNFMLALVKSNLGDPDDLIATNVISAEGRDGDVFWQFASNYRTVWTNSENNLGEFDPPVPRSASHVTNSYSGTAIGASMMREQLLTVLHFGLSLLKPDTLTWNGTHFETANTLGRKIDGELTIIDGYPERLQFKSGNPANFAVAHFEYHKPSLFPSKISVAHLYPDGKEKPVFEIKISRILFSTSPVAQHLFAPDIVAAKHALIEMNHAVYERVGKGNTLFNVTSHPHGGRLMRRQNRPWVVSLFTVVICSPIFYLIKWKSRATQQQTISRLNH